MSKFDVAIAMVAATCALIVTSGLLMVALWSWFVQPLFAGAPDLNAGEAIGLSLTVGYLRGASTSDRKRGAKITAADYGYTLSQGLARQALVLTVSVFLHYVFGVGR